jgi:phenylacetate-CoA ligase
LLERIEGRKSDFILAPDGRLMHGLSLIYILRKIAGIEQFRITQRKIDNFAVELVINAEFSPESESEIKREFWLRLRASVHVDIYYREVIHAAKSGKLRHVISEVSANNTRIERAAV